MENFDNIAYLVALVLSVLNAIITFVRTGTLKKEYKNMVYRSPDYQESLTDEEKAQQAQTFDNLKTEYRLNRNTGELEVQPDKTDLQSLINSSIHTAFDRVLSRLLPQEDLEGEIESEYDSVSDDLMDYAAILDKAEDYREQFELPDDMSVSDIFKRVQEESDSLKTRLDNLRKPVQKPVQAPVEKEKEIKEDVPSEKND